MKELGIEAKTFRNTKTGEELSVNILENAEIEIKRAREKNKEEEKELIRIRQTGMSKKLFYFILLFLPCFLKSNCYF